MISTRTELVSALNRIERSQKSDSKALQWESLLLRTADTVQERKLISLLYTVYSTDLVDQVTYS